MMARDPDKKRERDREYQRKYYEANREKIKEKSRAYYEANREKRRVYREANREKRRAYCEANREKIRENRLKKTYDLTLQQWEKLFEAQRCRCGACGSTEPGSKRGWSTDHDHETGLVRGILCHPCNRLLGMLGDNASGVLSSTQRFINYLTAKESK